MSDYRGNLIEDSDGVRKAVQDSKRIAVLGIKTEAQSGQPAFYVADYLASAGVEVVPVPVYYPEVKTILGQQVYRKVAEIPGEVDMVDVFRRSEEVAHVVGEALEHLPGLRVIWTQLGVRDDAAAGRARARGVLVIQDRCPAIEVPRLGIAPVT